MYNLVLEYNAEDVERLSRMFASFFAKLYTSRNRIANYETDESFSYFVTDAIRVDRLEELKHYVDLDKMSMEVLGVTNPIGQLSNWLAQQFNWIVKSIENIFNSIIQGFVNSVESFINMVKDAVLSAINGLSSQLNSFISEFSNFVQSIQNMISSGLSEIETTLENIPKMISSTLQNIISYLERLPSIIESELNSLTNMLKSSFNQFINMINRIPSLIESSFSNIGNMIRSLFTQLTNMLKNIPNMISSTFKELQTMFSSVVNELRNIITEIARTLSEIPSTIENMFSRIAKFIENIPKYIVTSFQSLEHWLQSIFRNIYRAVTSIYSFLENIFDRIEKYFSNFFSSIIQYFDKLSHIIVEGFSDFRTLLADVSSRIVGYITDLYNYIVRIPNIISKYIESYFGRLYNWLVSSIRTVENELIDFREFFASVWKHIMNGMTMIAHTFTGFVNAIMHFPEWFPKWFYDHIAKPIVEGFRLLAEWFWNLVPDWFKNAINIIEGFFHDVYNFFTKSLPNFFLHTLPSFFESLPKWFYIHIAEPIVNGLKNLGEWIWNHLPDCIKNAFIEIENFFKGVYDFFTKTLPDFFIHTLPTFFTKTIPSFFENLPKWFYVHIAEPIVKGIENLGKWIWEHLPNYIKNAISSIENFFRGVYEFFAKDLPSFFKSVEKSIVLLVNNPYKFIQEYIILPLYNDLESFIKYLVTCVRTASNIIMSAMLGFAKDVWNSITGFSKEIEGILLPFLAKARSGFISIFKTASTKMHEVIQKLSTGKIEGQGEIEVIGLALSDMIAESLPLLATPYIIKGIGALINRILFSIDPFGLGLRYGVKISKMINSFADSFKEAWIDTLKGVFIGYGMSVADIFSRAMDYYLNYMFRNYIPIELPTTHECLEMIRRVSVTKHFKDSFDFLMKFLELRGYSDKVIDLMLDPHLQYVFEIADRFGNKLVLDSALLFRLPSHTEICTFMMRDLFASFVDFTKLMMAHGYPQSASYMVWLLHFHYPSLKEVWEFTCRAIAGECWISKDSFIYRTILDDYQKLINGLRQAGLNINLYEPMDTADLNMVNGSVPQVVLEAIPKYARWLAKAPFAWIKDYTSDALMIVDITAKIPTKTDLRWFTRYGIFQAWSAWGITFSDNLESIHRKLILNHVAQNPQPVFQNMLHQLQTSQVTFDLRQFCRMLMAEGTHPLWVPWIAIAEAQLAYQSAKTLLRTGFIDLYRYGLADISILNNLLSGFFNITYLVSYFDLRQNKWFDAQVTLPVFYIPAEAKLYEIRSVMDRAYHLFNDLLRRLDYAVRLALVKPNDVINELEYFINGRGSSIFNIQLQKPLNEWYSNVMRIITGKEASITIDKDYINYVQYIMNVEYWTHIYERVRYWYLRILSASIYRIMYGYIEPSDIDQIVELAVKYGHVTPIEAEALKNLLNIIAGIVKREYIPTPYELATLAEYIPQVIKLAPEVFKKRGVPKEWQKIWLELIKIKPLRPFIHRLVEILERSTRYGMYVIDQLSRELSKLVEYGYTNEEIKLMLEYAEQDKALYYFEHVIPSLRGLADYYYYHPEFLDLLKKKLETVLADKQLFNKIGIIDVQKFYNLYIQYAINKSVRWIVRECITELVYLYGKGYIDDRMLEQYLRELAKYGLNKYQIELIKLKAQLRRMRYLR